MKKILSLTIVAFVVAGSYSIAKAQAQNRPVTSEQVSLNRTESGHGSFEQGLRPTVLWAGKTAPDWSIQERMAYYNVPGVAVAILKDGLVAFAAGYGVRAAGSQDPVDANTLFSVGSVSKIVTAAITLRLVAENKLELDRNVDSYLTSWHIPADPDFPDAVVTLRMLMPHTSGLNVHGFADYLPNEPLPTLVQTLNGTKPAKNAPVNLIYKPGTRFDYSGGGVEVQQLVIEEVTGSSLETVAREQVFDPLGMRRSTFANPLPAARGNIAKAHDEEGKLTALPRGWQTFPEQAASGLWTSSNDLGKFVGALIKSYQGTADFLPRPIARDMMTEVSPSWHGLGPRLNGAAATYYFHHGGANASYRAWIEGHLETGEGLVILTNGSNGGDLYDEIRNAVSDMLDWSINPPVYTIDLGPDPALGDFAGTYRVDETMPMNLRRALVEAPDVQEIQVDHGQVSVYFPGSIEPIALLPLTPTRFVHLVAGWPYQHVFYREANGSVNGFTLKRGAARTYYRRQPPMQQRPISRILAKVISDEGVHAAVACYRKLKESAPDAYDFSESELNRLGHYYLADDDIEIAIRIFQLNVEAHPESANAYDSLGGAYMEAGKRKRAIQTYRNALELNPDSENATRMLEQLGVGVERVR